MRWNASLLLAEAVQVNLAPLPRPHGCAARQYSRLLRSLSLPLPPCGAGARGDVGFVRAFPICPTFLSSLVGPRLLTITPDLDHLAIPICHTHVLTNTQPTTAKTTGFERPLVSPLR
eukprot:EG_transcript_52878